MSYNSYLFWALKRVSHLTKLVSFANVEFVIAANLVCGR